MSYEYPTGDSGGSYGYPTTPPVSGSSRPLDLTGDQDYGPGKLPRGDGQADYFQLANGLQRWGAGLIDYLPLLALQYAIGHLSAVLAYLINIGLMGANNVYLQGMTGQSIGKRVFGMQVVWGAVDRSGNRSVVTPGVVRCLVRQLLHIVDAIPAYIGFLWPFWSYWRQTFADRLAGTYVLKLDEVEHFGFPDPGSRTARG